MLEKLRLAALQTLGVCFYNIMESSCNVTNAWASAFKVILRFGGNNGYLFYNP